MLRKSLVLCLFAALISACGDTAPPPDAGVCAPGGAGCACLAGGLCGAGLVCDTGLCRAVSTSGLTVTNAAARSCEVVLVEAGTEVLGVDFADGTLGTQVHESPRTAVTFTRQTDTPFAAGAVTVRRTDGMGAAVTLSHARCFDREGNALPGDSLRLGN